MSDMELFKTIVPLNGIGASGSTGELSNNEVADKLPNNVAGLLTSAEMAFLSSLLSFFDECEWITNSQAREATGKSDGSVKRFMRNLTSKGAFEARGETKDRQYRLALPND